MKRTPAQAAALKTAAAMARAERNREKQVKAIGQRFGTYIYGELTRVKDLTAAERQEIFSDICRIAQAIVLKQ